MKKIISYKLNRANPRLSDEEIDPLELDDLEHLSSKLPMENWTVNGHDDMMDVMRVVENVLPTAQRIVIEAFLSGQDNNDIGVSEKFWRYHFAKAVESIKKELGL